MKRAGEKSSNKLGLVIAALVAVVVLVAGFIFFNPFGGTKSSSTAKKTTGTSSTKQETKYEPSQEEKDYLKNRFAQLTAANLRQSLMSMHRVLSWMNLLYKPLTMKLI